MIATPPIPDWIKTFRHVGYTNVFDQFQGETKLYGTETLFSDWSAPTLLLAKDAAPTPVIKESGWRHADRNDPGGWRTNERLVTLASTIPGAKLYGSATANMLYDDPRWSRSLPGFWRGPLHEYLVQVLGWVINSMPNLRVIACLGKEAWHTTSVAIGQASVGARWNHYRDNGLVLSGRVGQRSILVTAHYHPAARVSNTDIQLSWTVLGDVLRAPA